MQLFVYITQTLFQFEPDMTKSNFGYGTFSLKGTIRGTESFVRIGDCPIYELMERRNWVRIGRLQSVGLYFTITISKWPFENGSKVMQHWNLWICKLACCRRQQKALEEVKSLTLYEIHANIWTESRSNKVDLLLFWPFFHTNRPSFGRNDCSKKAVRSPWLSQI